jgi:hypothetical protein
VTELKYLRITVTKGNYRCEEIKSRLNSVTTCYPLNQNFSLVVRIKTYKTVALHVVYICGLLPNLHQRERK